MDTAWGLTHLYHEACTLIMSQRHQQNYAEKLRLQYWHQRNQPDGELEEMALATYAKRGYDVLWMPIQAPFDYVVNGLSVDVKGACLNQIGTWRFGLPWWTKNNHETQMLKRCEIAHLIGKVNGKFQHFIVPTNSIGLRKNICFYPVPQLFFCDGCGAQFPTEQGLQVHQARWCGVTPNWQQYHNNWWRLENHQ